MNILFNWIPAFAGTTNKTSTTAMDGGSANYAGAVICLPLMDGGSANYAGAIICLPLMDGGSANNAGAVICPYFNPSYILASKHNGTLYNGVTPIPT